MKDQLQQIKSIKEEIKAILLEKGVIDSTTPFTEYASIIEKMEVTS